MATEDEDEKHADEATGGRKEEGTQRSEKSIRLKICSKPGEKSGPVERGELLLLLLLSPSAPPPPPPPPLLLPAPVFLT